MLNNRLLFAALLDAARSQWTALGCLFLEFLQLLLFLLLLLFEREIFLHLVIVSWRDHLVQIVVLFLGLL
jgi:hypothetical protein